MRASRLTKLWVAERFLKPDQSKSFEETAEEYLEDLVKRSLFLVSERKSNGGIKFLGIHDLMREMCIRKAKEENFFLHVRELLQKGMRLSHRVSTSILNFLANVDGATIRTIIYLKHRFEGKLRPLEYFKLLRILAVSNDWGYFSEKDPSLPVQVYELFHLRYLSFDGPCKDLASISNLRSLQTIIIRRKNKFSIWYLVQNIKYLQQLETLKIVNGVSDRPMLFSAFPKTLKKLSLQYLNFYWEDMSAVASLPHLEVLKLRWGACIGDMWETSEGGFPELNYLLIDT